MTEQTAKHIEGMAELNPQEMSYWKAGGNWQLYIPGCGVGTLSAHTITEHEDGTITASPSILMDGHEKGTPTKKHGYLTRGIWKEC